MDALSFPFPHASSSPGPRSPAAGAGGAADAASAPRPHAWLTSVGARLRGTLGGFPDAIWLGTATATWIVECDEDGGWTRGHRAAPATGAPFADMPLPPGVHEVPDVVDDDAFDAYPTAARWPMARRLCRIVFESAHALEPGPVMMLVGSLPGRLSPAHRQALEDWVPAASALLGMVLASDARR